MKNKILKVLFLSLFMMALTGLLVACDDTPPDPEVVRYTVIFDVNAGNDSVQNEPDVVRVDENTVVAEPTPDPIRSGYDFVGWYTNVNGTGDPFDFTTPITSNNFILYAVWSETIIYYSIIIDYQGSETNQTLTIEEGGTVTEPSDPSREGYRFDGWFIDTDFTTAYNFSSTVDSDFSLYAKWIEQVTITVDLNYEGAPTAVEETVDYGSTIATPTTPTREGYTFAGWYSDIALTVTYEFTAIESDITIYAKWVDASAPTYTVTFDLNYVGAPTIDDQEISEGAVISQPATVRASYRFVGWFSDMALSVPFNVTTPITEDISLYAKWVETVVLSINYNYTGAVNPNPVTVDKDSSITPIQNPSRTGFTFAGWSDEVLGSIGYDYQSGISEDTTIYAQWSKTYVFEAEDLDFTGFEGPGFSGAAFGTDVIAEDLTSASNEHYVTYLYSDGISLTFTIESDRAVDNVTLIARLSGEYEDFYIAPTAITPETPVYTITVNGTPVIYSPIYFDNVPSLGSGLLPFQDFTLSVNVSLVEGTNTIVLLTDNDIAMGGTMVATAPMVDAIKINTYAILTWDPVEGNY